MFTSFKKLSIIATFISLGISQVSFAAHDRVTFNQKTFQCYVVSVLDGDTLDCIKQDKTQHRIRLANIDAPEKGQPYSIKARQRLANLTFNKSVTIAYETSDRYGRVIGEVFPVGEQYTANYRLVQEGLAWAYERYITDRAYLTAQSYAKNARIGLWRDPNAINPEQWRLKNK